MLRSACVIILLLVSFKSSVFAVEQMPSSQFSNYKIVKINDYPLLIDPQLKYHLIKNAPDNQTFGWAFGEKLARMACGKYTITIGFSYGPSEDPSYLIFVSKGGTTVFSRWIYATGLAISSACQFYPSGHTNNNFDMHRKFTIKDNSIHETKQPFYLVDKVCPLNEDVTLTTEPCSKGTVVAKLPKGTNVRILLSEPFKEDENGYLIGKCDKGESYLVNTPFGLVGWVETYVGTINNPGCPLSCIYTNGD